MRNPDPDADSKAGLSAFVTETGDEYGSFVVEWLGPDDGFAESGWYWSACWPGCVPDDDWNGPFETSLAAWLDARNT